MIESKVSIFFNVKYIKKKAFHRTAIIVTTGWNARGFAYGGRTKDVYVCAVWGDIIRLIPLFENNKTNVDYYCDRCLQSVKASVQFAIPWGSNVN
ncbi:hypothetical protein [Peribacillus butanolivorans]|uniref:hypothetical protein n=1 Tax=Peribacillus butanolivorans TaxID=421767 RepID=UPI00366759E3